MRKSVAFPDLIPGISIDRQLASRSVLVPSLDQDEDEKVNEADEMMKY
jgi:hypothetical protein